MNTAQKYQCKAIVRDVIEDWKEYNYHNKPTYAEKSLFLNTISSMIDKFPGTTAYGRFETSGYVIGILERIIGA
jgi:hypothetical protein